MEAFPDEPEIHGGSGKGEKDHDGDGPGKACGDTVTLEREENADRNR